MNGLMTSTLPPAPARSYRRSGERVNIPSASWASRKLIYENVQNTGVTFHHELIVSVAAGMKVAAAHSLFRRLKRPSSGFSWMVAASTHPTRLKPKSSMMPLAQS